MTSNTSSLVLVMERFPRHGETLERLYEKSGSFRSLCSDYQKCLSLHELCLRPIAEAAAGFQKNCRILPYELEVEILNYVAREGELIDYRTQEME